MKTTDPRDPLDQKIDALLASRPIEPSADFLDRVLAATDELDQNAASSRTGTSSHTTRFLRWGFGIAAAIALAFVGMQMRPSTVPVISQPSQSLSSNDAQEILMLEEGLSNLPEIESNAGSLQLLATFDAIFFEIES
jgi:hypothetical protein